GVADVNHDGFKDVVIRNGSGGQWVYYMQGTTVVSGGSASVTVDQLLPLTPPNAGTDLVQASISYVLPTGIGNLTRTGPGNINGNGNSVANVIVGNSGDNIISGKGGADMLTGNAGADTFVFDAFANGMATVTDFAHGVDALQISAAGFGGGLTPG